MLFVLTIAGGLTTIDDFKDGYCPLVAKELSKSAQVSAAFCVGSDDDDNPIIKK